MRLPTSEWAPEDVVIAPPGRCEELGEELAHPIYRIK